MSDRRYDLIYTDGEAETDLVHACGKEYGQQLASSYAEAKKQVLLSWQAHLTGFVAKARFVDEPDRKHAEYRLEELL